MPRLSPTSLGARILHVHLNKGSVVNSYDLALTICVKSLTSVAVSVSDGEGTEMELEVLEDGFRVAEVLVEAGRDVAIGDALAILLDEDLDEDLDVGRLEDVKSELDLFDSCLLQAYVK